MASPTPMGSSHFASLSRRPSSRQGYRQPPSRPHFTRAESRVAEAHAHHYSLNDSSDDEIPMPMKLSAYTDALLNGETSMVEKSPLKPARTSPDPDTYGRRQIRAGSVSSIDLSKQDRTSPPGSGVHSPYPRRVVRLSGTPGSSTLRRNNSLSAAVQKHNEPIAGAESPLDLSTPAQVPRTVRIPITASVHNGTSAGSSGKLSSRTNSASRSDEEGVGSQEHPTTVARSYLATSQGSVSRHGSSTIGRTRYDEDAGLASTMRVRKVPGRMMALAARRGRRRVDDEEQSPLEEQGDVLDNAGSSQEPQSQESQVPESQASDPGSSQEPEANRASLYSATYRDFASGSPVSSKDILNSILRSKSPPPPTLTSSQRSGAADSNSPAAKQEQPIFKVPAPRPDLPSAHDQENEAPPTFKRNKQAPLIQFDKIEKVPVRPESLDLDVLRAAISPDRRPLAPRSQNTPRRPAPPPPKMSILDAATSTAGAATTSQAGGKKNRLKVNGKQFTRLDCIGRGGSSRVYRVMAENSQFFALKRVSLDDADEMAVAGFKGEIDLLKKLEGVERVIRLWDFELNEAKGTLSVVSKLDWLLHCKD
jgi:serine/threonine-protein kinase TTK/MPS1